jgi:hypothetical protein
MRKGAVENPGREFRFEESGDVLVAKEFAKIHILRGCGFDWLLNLQNP